MSDPLTALMHAVQVMNLLKTLILRTLRDREETSTEGYSPMSFHSSDRESEDYYDSQQEMDTSGELRETKSDYNEHVDYIHNIEEEEEEEAAFVSEIEECFLKQLNDENTKKLSEEKMKSVTSFTDTKDENSCLSSTFGDESTNSTAEGSNVDISSPSTGSTSANDVEMMDKFSDSFSLLPLFASS